MRIGGQIGKKILLAKVSSYKLVCIARDGQIPLDFVASMQFFLPEKVIAFICSAKIVPRGATGISVVNAAGFAWGLIGNCCAINDGGKCV